MSLGNTFENVKGRVVSGTAAAMILAASFGTATANDNVQQANYQSVKSDYVTDCRSGNCAGTDATGWSKELENWQGVAVSVRMGTQPARTDQQIKDFLTKGFEHFGVENYKFFFEQNDAIATGITFHVRGGSSDLYKLSDDLKPAVKRYARQAVNPNFARNGNDDLAIANARDITP